MKILTNLRQQFCERYWSQKAKLPKRDYVELQCALYSANVKLLTGRGLSLQEFKRRYGVSFERVINQTDREFKSLRETTKEMIVYRGVSEPKGKEHPLLKKLYQKSLNIKENDTIAARGYAFAALEQSLAKLFGLHANKAGILYEIRIPKGARVSMRWDEVVFPRYSKFKCLESKEIVNVEGKCMFKRMEYIVPKEKSGWFY